MGKHPRLTRPASLLPAVVLLLIGPSAIARGDGTAWLPLEVGNRWEYVATGGGGYAEQITGTVALLGRTVFVKSYIGGPNDGLENYWLTGADGRVLLAGFNNRPASFALGYEPPMELLGAPPALGLGWDTHARIYDLSDTTLTDSLDIRWQVLEDVALTVPAGGFPSFGVGQVPLSARSQRVLAVTGGRSFTLDGRVVSTGATGAASGATDWFAQGVGVVQLQSDALYQLARFGNTTPVARTSWGRVKQLYR